MSKASVEQKQEAFLTQFRPKPYDLCTWPNASRAEAVLTCVEDWVDPAHQSPQRPAVAPEEPE
jgi:hypothetical protein